MGGLLIFEEVNRAMGLFNMTILYTSILKKDHTVFQSKMQSAKGASPRLTEV